MNFLLSDAMAQTAQPQAGGSIASFIPLVLLFAAMYFIVIRPQKKKMKDHQDLVDALAKGDEIMTNGGILGKIISVHDSFITVEIAQNVTIKLQRSAVSHVMPKDTIKSIK